jgi:hypothetical protein
VHCNDSGAIRVERTAYDWQYVFHNVDGSERQFTPREFVRNLTAATRRQAVAHPEQWVDVTTSALLGE